MKQFHGPQKPNRKLFGLCLPSETPPPTSRAAVPEVGLVINGKTLNAIFQGKLEMKFLELTQYCRSVLCCRSTPLQKSMIVKLVRDKLSVMTLSIGTHHAEMWVQLVRLIWQKSWARGGRSRIKVETARLRIIFSDCESSKWQSIRGSWRWNRG